MTFELTILGSSSALPTSTKYPAAHVLNVHERFFLIDCGEGTQIQLRKAGIRFGKIRHVCISHLHGDHVFGLFGLLSTFELLGRREILHLYGPPGLQNLLEFYRSNFSPDPAYAVKLHTLSERKPQLVYEDKVVEVTAFPLKHRVPAFGYFFREKQKPLNIRKKKIDEYNLSVKQIRAVKSGSDALLDDGRTIANEELTEPPLKRRSFAYCSDTAYFEKNTGLLEHVDLLYHEATFLQRDQILARETGHSTAEQAARFALKAKAKQLLIGHFSNRYKQTEEFLSEAKKTFENTHIAIELEKYTVEPERTHREGEKKSSHL